jgi:hypothetical protein
MTIAHLKSAYVTNLDASPPVSNTAGEGGAAYLKCIEGSTLAGATSSLGSTYQFVRVPSNAKIKKIYFESTTQADGTLNLGLYYATDGLAQRPLALVAASAISSNLFATAIDCTGSVVITDVTNESNSYTPDIRSQPLWQAAGLTTDPGGNFDLVGTVSVSVTTGTGRWGITVFYTD